MQEQKHISLKPYNTFGLDVVAHNFLEFSSVEELSTIRKKGVFEGKHLILGGGSNILLLHDFEGTVLRNCVAGIEVLVNADDHCLVKFGAGENWHSSVMWSIENNLGGIENLSLIPGTVGAAPMQNIGAYGVEIKDVFVELEAFNKETGELELFDAEQCAFGYRESVFKNVLKDQFVIVSMTLRLNKPPHEVHTAYGAIQSQLAEMGVAKPSIQDVSKAVIAIRQSKLPDPKEIGNSGSFFKNPVVSEEKAIELRKEHPNMPNYPAASGVKLAAGWLIEQCGWKGKRVGQTGAHARQALVLVNYGNAKGVDVWALAQQIQSSVKERFGVDLHAEVNVVS